MPRNRRISGHIRLAVACAATLGVLGPLAWLWQDSLLPDAYSVMDMGYADYGGAPPAAAGHEAHGGAAGHGAHARPPGSGRDVTRLTPRADLPADVAVTMVARKQRFTLPSGRAFEGYTLNGESDRKAGKYSIPVRIGRNSAVIYHWFLIFGGLSTSIIYTILTTDSLWAWLFLLSTPLFILNGFAVSQKPSDQLDSYLKQMALSTLLFVLLFGAGIILSVRF
jgi:hypothetical protein